MAESARPLFSIGAVSRMLDLAPATIRTWETRYRLVVPERSGGGQRLYSRDHVAQLRFIKGRVQAGTRPGEAHRLLSERVARGESPNGSRHRVLLVESRHGAARLLRELLGERFEVMIASDPVEAHRAYDEHEPALVVIDTADVDFEELAERLRSRGTKILPLELLDRPLEWLGEPRAVPGR
jgi:DNA-binding transcriptional MerR regulator